MSPSPPRAPPTRAGAVVTVRSGLESLRPDLSPSPGHYLHTPLTPVSYRCVAG